MPRPRIRRRVGFHPGITYFKPSGVRVVDLDESVLTVDEFEAIRLKDFLELDQDEAAKKMKISQPTFHRLLLSARKKIADAIVNGKAIRIEGGDFMVRPRRGAGVGRAGGGRGLRGRAPATGGRGLGGGFGMGPNGECICPKCETRVPHQIGQACYQMKCPKCGTPMTRAR